jgi:predicted DsbA family dithiol-disulfide isomerase
MSDDVLRVWCDFLCPYARIGTLWLRNVDAAGGLGLPIEWKAFSLEETNLEPDADREELWATPERRRGILPAAAAKWASARGSEDFETVQRAFFEANHVDRKKIGKPEVVEEVLTSAGFDGAVVVKELLTDRRWLDEVRADCAEAEELGVFGVPTLVFPDCRPVFCRLLEVTEGDRAVEIYERVRTMAHDPIIHELKRPTGHRA